MATDDKDHDGRSTALTRRRDAAIERVGEDAVYAMLADGMTRAEIADAIGLDGSDYNARRAVYQWLRRDKERFDEARRESSDALAEQAMEVYGDEAPETSADAKYRNDKAGHLRWMAEMRSGVGRGLNVNIDIGELHLDALKRAGSMRDAQGGREILAADYEIKEGG